MRHFLVAVKEEYVRDVQVMVEPVENECDDFYNDDKWSDMFGQLIFGTLSAETEAEAISEAAKKYTVANEHLIVYELAD